MRFKLTLISIAATVTLGAHAAEWSDTSVALSYGTKFTEPFGATDVSKNIYLLKHVSGDKYGENLFKAEMLQSNSKNPGTNDSAGGAQEVYAIYRRLFDLQKMSGTSYAFGPFKNIGVTAGFDWNTKNDAYGSKKRMFVIGPTFITDINNGFFNISLLLLDESNDPNGGRSAYSAGRYHYKNHLDLSLGWAVPTGVDNLSFEGWSDFIAAKGKLESGADSAPETHIYTSLMYDVSAPVGASKNTLKLGVGYEYWKNKFGNKYSAAANPGAFAKTPFAKLEYHF